MIQQGGAINGYARTAGELIQQLTIDGRRYTLRAPPVARLIGEMEAYVLAQHTNPFVQAAEAASVRANMATAEEMNAFEESVRGIAFKFWKCLEQDHGEEIRSVDDAMELLAKLVEERGPAGLEEIVARTRTVTGETDAKKLIWPGPEDSGRQHEPQAEITGWPAVFEYSARRYRYTPEQVGRLKLIPLCILLGAITPDHQIHRLPPADYLRLSHTQDNRRLLKLIHGR